MRLGPGRLAEGSPKICFPRGCIARDGRHLRGMVPTRYQIVVQHDGNYGVVLTQLGATVRTATGFANKAEAQAWVARDAKSENADNPFRERGPENPQEADPFRKGDSVV